jgi:hypothetical protein
MARISVTWEINGFDAMDEDVVEPQPEPVIDRVTRELRREFRAINKAAEREAAELLLKKKRMEKRAKREKSRKKRSNQPPSNVWTAPRDEESLGRKLAKAVLGELAKPDRPVRMNSVEHLKRLSEINRNLAQQDKKRVESKQKAAERAAMAELREQEAYAKWKSRECWRCKSQFKIHVDWVNPPTMCKACAKDIDQTYVPGGRDRDTKFTSISIVRGGAPGSGRRR